MNNGTWYGNEYRDIRNSSLNPTAYKAKWYRRKNNTEDPWISLTNHNESIDEGNILYGENGYGGIWASNILPHHNRANVYIRKKGFFFLIKYMIQNSARNIPFTSLLMIS
jgi:hypothetical protein